MTTQVLWARICETICLRYTVCAISEWGEEKWSTLWKVSTHYCLSLKMETSLDHHDLSKIIETGLTMMLANFLSTCGCLPSGLRDLCMSNLFKCSLLPSQRVSFPCSRHSSWCLVPGILKAGLISKNRDAEVMVTLVFSIASCKGPHSHSAAGPHFP